MAKLAIGVRNAADLLVLDRQGLVFDASLAPILRLAVGQNVLFRLSEATSEYAAVGRLATIEVEERVAVARFDAIRPFDRQAQFSAPDLGSPSIGILDDATFEAVLALAENSDTRLVGREIGALFVSEDEEAKTPLETFAAIVKTVLREANYRCAATGTALDVETPAAPQVFVLRPKDAGGMAHVNNCLALSPGAFAAFEAGHLAARDDFSIIADLRGIDPELLEALNASGRLTVSDNPALQPVARNLSYHRQRIFGLG